ncbi:MAG: hypothetical protein Q7S32_03740 [bacterium]|nr:hypothetical protein [bacterium]
MMWLCVVIVFSLISFVWFKSTQAKFVAMLHPEEAKQLAEQRNLAESNQDSPLAGLRSSFALLRASLGELLRGESTDLTRDAEKPQPKEDDAPSQELPLSPDKTN